MLFNTAVHTDRWTDKVLQWKHLRRCLRNVKPYTIPFCSVAGYVPGENIFGQILGQAVEGGEGDCGVNHGQSRLSLHISVQSLNKTPD